MVRGCGRCSGERGPEKARWSIACWAGNVTAANFRRTFTAGPVAVASGGGSGPMAGSAAYRGSARRDCRVRGEADSLTIVQADHSLLHHVALVDTPDLDGDQPLHHAQADRVFRWAQAVVFFVSPEKYQMTELLPYYRLARRYAIPALFVMNKCQEQAVIDDYAFNSASAVLPRPWFFALPRVDAGFEPPAGAGIDDLRQALLAFLQCRTTRGTNGAGQPGRGFAGPLERPDHRSPARNSVPKPKNFLRRCIRWTGAGAGHRR